MEWLRRNWRMTLGVLLATLLGAFFRLFDMGATAMRADTILFWTVCNRPLSLADLFTHWNELVGGGQFPLAMASAKWLVEALNLPMTHATIHLSSAVWGTLAILAAFGAGRAMGSSRYGLCFALLVAVSPFHIQVSREAYYYPPLSVGAFLCLWAVLWTIGFLQGKLRITPLFYLVNALGFFLLTYSQPTGWPFAFLVVLTILGGATWRTFKRGDFKVPFVIVTATFLLVGLPLLMSDWGLKQMMGVAAQKDAGLKALAVSEGSVWTMLAGVVKSYAWGGTPVRLGFTLLALAMGLSLAWVNRRKDWRFATLILLLAIGFGLYLVARSRTGALYESRYVLVLFPAYLLLLSMGLIGAGELISRWVRNPGVQQAVSCGCVAAGVLMNLHPAWLVSRLTGNPIPYKAITAWCDANLPPGSPVLVDRWFEPWNELAVYPSTNVTYTFTVPNEPVDVYIKYAWRDTAKAFLMAFPDAAYLEVAKSYWNVVGPWTWPRSYFRHCVTFTNEAGLRLREMALATRGDFFASDSNRLVVPLFFNRPEDILDLARAEGRATQILFERGWAYEKTGPMRIFRIQTQDFHDWRRLEGRGMIEIHNLAGNAVTGELMVRAVAVGGVKQVQAGPTARKTFNPGAMETWAIPMPELKPGRNEVVIEDLSNARNEIPLLVDAVEFHPNPASVSKAGVLPATQFEPQINANRRK